MTNNKPNIPGLLSETPPSDESWRKTIMRRAAREGKLLAINYIHIYIKYILMIQKIANVRLVYYSFYALSVSPEQ